MGASGHSAGGLSAILAASRDTRIRAVSTMDPVDNGGLGVAALPGISAPVAITYSEPSSCNANGSALLLYNAAVARIPSFAFYMLRILLHWVTKKDSPMCLERNHRQTTRR